MTISELAALVRQDFEKAIREDRTQYWTLKPANAEGTGANDWTKDMVYEAHAGMLPDDFRYRVIVEALDWIAERGDDDVPSDEIGYLFADDVDVYTGQLVAWLGSHSLRVGYCDDAASEYFTADADISITDRIIAGQMMERREIFELVLSALEAKLSELGDA